MKAFFIKEMFRPLAFKPFRMRIGKKVRQIMAGHAQAAACVRPFFPAAGPPVLRHSYSFFTAGIRVSFHENPRCKGGVFMKITQSKTFWRAVWIAAVALGGIPLVKVAIEILNRTDKKYIEL